MHVFGFRLWDDWIRHPITGPHVHMDGSQYREFQVSPYPGDAPHGPREMWENGIPPDALTDDEVGEACGVTQWSAPIALEWTFTPEEPPASETLAGAGGLVWGGAAGYPPQPVQIGTGGLAFGGSAPVVEPPGLVATGGLAFGGSAPPIPGPVLTATGGLVWGGAGRFVTDQRLIATGGLVWGGASPPSVTVPVQVGGGLVWGGAGRFVTDQRLIATGGLVWGGASPPVVIVPIPIAAGGLVWGGAAAQGTGKQQTGTGGLVWGGAATITEDETVTGQVIYWAGTGAIPAGWLKCDGSAVSRTTYAALFATIGTAFGVGDGTTTFNLPNCAGRYITQQGGSWGAPATGGYSGSATATLSVNNIPAHTHAITAHLRTGAVTGNGAGLELGDPGVGTTTVNPASYGSTPLPFNILPPGVSMTALIKT